MDAPLDRTDLQHPYTQRILGLLAREPGLNKRQIGIRTSLSIPVVEYHIGYLLGRGLVLRLPSSRGQEHLYFLEEDRHLWENERTRILFGRDNARRVSRCIVANPGKNARELADLLDIKARAILHNVHQLQEANLVKTEQDGRAHRYHATDELIAWLNAYDARKEGTTQEA